jgi:DNA-binding Xre family transcriptional regulator
MKSNKMHIGELIKSVVEQNNIRTVDLAKSLGKSRQNIYDLYKRSDVEVKLLLAICKATNYDFFQHFRMNDISEPPTTDVSINLKVNAKNLDELFQWISENGNIKISRKDE